MSRHEVVSPIPGVFYRRPTRTARCSRRPASRRGRPDDLPGRGHEVVPLALAGAAGTLVEFLVENEDVVDAGQPVAVIEDGG